MQAESDSGDSTEWKILADIRQGQLVTSAHGSVRVFSLLSGESLKNCTLATQGPRTNFSATFQSISLPQ